MKQSSPEAQTNTEPGPDQNNHPALILTGTDAPFKPNSYSTTFLNSLKTPPESFPPTQQSQDRSWEPLLLCPTAQTSRVWGSPPAPSIKSSCSPTSSPCSRWVSAHPTLPSCTINIPLLPPGWECWGREMVQEEEN